MQHQINHHSKSSFQKKNPQSYSVHPYSYNQHQKNSIQTEFYDDEGSNHEQDDQSHMMRQRDDANGYFQSKKLLKKDFTTEESVSSEEFESKNQGMSTFADQHTHLGRQSKSILEKNPSKTPQQLIERNIRKYQKTIKKNKGTIEQLECQRQFFLRLSEKQKAKLESTDINRMKAHYEDEITSLQKQKATLHEMIANMHQQTLRNQVSYEETAGKIKENKNFLMDTLLKLEKENETLKELTVSNSKQNDGLRVNLEKNEIVLIEKESIEAEYEKLKAQVEAMEKLML